MWYNLKKKDPKLRVFLRRGLSDVKKTLPEAEIY